MGCVKSRQHFQTAPLISQAVNIIRPAGILGRDRRNGKQDHKNVQQRGGHDGHGQYVKGLLMTELEFPGRMGDIFKTDESPWRDQRDTCHLG